MDPEELLSFSQRETCGGPASRRLSFLSGRAGSPWAGGARPQGQGRRRFSPDAALTEEVSVWNGRGARNARLVPRTAFPDVVLCSRPGRFCLHRRAVLLPLQRERLELRAGAMTLEARGCQGKQALPGGDLRGMIRFLFFFFFFIM